jgi:hypothetical protein
MLEKGAHSQIEQSRNIEELPANFLWRSDIWWNIRRIYLGKEKIMSKKQHLGLTYVSRNDTKLYALTPVGTNGRFVVEHIEGKGDYDGNKLIRAKNKKKLAETIMEMLDDPRYGEVLITACSDL